MAVIIIIVIANPETPIILVKTFLWRRGTQVVMVLSEANLTI